MDKIKGVSRATLLLAVLGDSLFLLSPSFWQLLAVCGLWLHHCDLWVQHLQNSLCSVLTSPPLCMCSNLFLTSSYKEACVCILVLSDSPPPAIHAHKLSFSVLLSQGLSTKTGPLHFVLVFHETKAHWSWRPTEKDPLLYDIIRILTVPATGVCHEAAEEFLRLERALESPGGFVKMKVPGFTTWNSYTMGLGWGLRKWHFILKQMLVYHLQGSCFGRD